MNDGLRVLIIGAGGQLGRAVATSAPPDVFAVPATHSDFDIADVARAASFVADHRPHVIVNAAAYTAVDQAETDTLAAERVNAFGARSIALAAAATGARLIHVSTDFVFDGCASTPYLVSSPARPLSVYGSTKLAGERQVTETLPGRSVVLRSAWLYSASGRNFLVTMLRLMRERGAVRVVADQVGTPTSTTSLASAIWHFVALGVTAGIYHWTDAGVASWYDFAVAIAEEAAARGLVSEDVSVIPITTAEHPTPAKRPAYSVLDTSATMRALGLQPVHWRVALRRVLDAIATT